MHGGISSTKLPSFLKVACITFLHLFIHGAVALAGVRLAKIYSEIDSISADKYALYTIDVIQICAAAILAAWMLFLLADTSRLGGIWTRLADINAGYQIPTKTDMVFVSLVVIASTAVLQHFYCNSLGSGSWSCINIWVGFMVLLGAYLVWVALKRRSGAQIPNSRPKLSYTDKMLFISASIAAVSGSLLTYATIRLW